MKKVFVVLVGVILAALFLSAWTKDWRGRAVQQEAIQAAQEEPRHATFVLPADRKVTPSTPEEVQAEKARANAKHLMEVKARTRLHGLPPTKLNRLTQKTINHRAPSYPLRPSHETEQQQ